MLRRCDGILFWFPCESICPIVLFELGTHLMVPGKPLFIGMHPDINAASTWRNRRASSAPTSRLFIASRHSLGRSGLGSHGFGNFPLLARRDPMILDITELSHRFDDKNKEQRRSRS